MENTILSIKGQIGPGYFSDFRSILIKDEKGYTIDLICKLYELSLNYDFKKVNVHYWISSEPKSKDDINKNVIKNLYGILDSGYEATTYDWGGWTGASTERESILSIGGHNIFNELSCYEGKYLFLEIHIAK